MALEIPYSMRSFLKHLLLYLSEPGLLCRS